MSEEEGKKKDSDVRSVDVGIGHYDDLAVAELCKVKFLSDSASERLDYRYERLVGINLVGSCLFYVKNLTSERKDSLESRIASLLCRASRGVSLYEIASLVVIRASSFTKPFS